jgi:hypothetical protein
MRKDKHEPMNIVWRLDWFWSVTVREVVYKIEGQNTLEVAK